MQDILNSSPLFLRENSKQLKNETQEEKTQSNSSLKNDNSVSFCQINESPLVQCDEDSSKNIWQDSENTLNDFLEESPFSIYLYDKTPLSNSKLNISVDENISVDKSSSFNQSKDTYNLNESNEFECLFLNMPKLNEDEEKMSRFSGDSFLSSLEITPNQEFINFENNEFNFNIIDGGKNDSIDISIKEPIDEMKEKEKEKEKESLNKNDLIEDKKKAKINFFVSKKDNNISNNPENKNNNKDLEKKKISENEYLCKKREKNNKNQSSDIRKNIKYNNLHEINKVTIINPKAYKCECGKIFSTEENQRLHYINIHLHEKPYNCSFCGEGFSHRNGKIYHERVYHTFIFPYPCKLCNSAFASKSAMIYHIKSKHKIN
jgi:hypothetical protein